MEIIDQDKKATKAHNRRYTRGKVIGGLFVVAAGVAWLIKELGYGLPDWLLSWEMFLIALGVYIGIKHNFRHPGWFILTAIGGIFLAGHLFPDLVISSLVWPILIIIFGVMIMFKPRRHPCRDERHWKRWEHKWKDKWEWEQNQAQTANADGNDMIETVSVFAGVKKHVISKNFKGGEVVCVFGGAEINLSQADINGTAVMELTQVFGGTKLIVPAHWEIQHQDMVAILGGIEDKRPVLTDMVGAGDKVLVLRGTCLFGGIEIKSYS